MEIEVTYSNGDKETITTGFTVSPSGALATTDTEVTVSFSGRTASVSITVEEDDFLETVAIPIPSDDEEEMAGDLWGKEAVFPGHIWVYLRRVAAEGSDVKDPTTTDANRHGTYPISKIIPSYELGDNVEINIISAAIIRHDTGARTVFSPDDTVGSIFVDAAGKLKPWIAPNTAALTTYLAGGGVGSKTNNMTTEYVVQFSIDGRTSDNYTILLAHNSADFSGTW